MLIRERMTRNPVLCHPDLPVNEAFDLMKKEHIRRIPVVDKNGKLVGIVSDKDLLRVSPSPATTLSVYEIPYLLSKVKAGDVMTRKVITVSEDTPIEDAARIMVDNKIGGLPVVNQEAVVVGIITETDIFKTFLELTCAQARRGLPYVKDVRRAGAHGQGRGRRGAAISSLPWKRPHRFDHREVHQATGPRAVVEALKPIAVRIVDVREG
jgi:CBS domain-containing protein